ncbi:replicative DNA helicase [Marinithermofilum abyssi]|uniref:Replicative DNA helicase n=1 Tax=Marinithermofilum abyssi TaxID=1571185 RepID=A0A8J2VF79_9BACL|nr:replicative DNA helicase [Marinithermofilum abyssi]GGE16314.1 replicative DNA helicase [Marinithermofilum abyssi]
MELTLPCNTQIENELIGAMIVDSECIPDLVELLQPEDFYQRSHQQLCRKIFELWRKHKRIELASELQLLSQFSGLAISALTEICGAVITTDPETLRYRADRLKSIATHRRFVQFGAEVAGMGYLKGSEEIREMINRAEAKLSRIAENQLCVQTMSTAQEAVMRYADRFDERIKNKSLITGVPSGLLDLDRYTAGFQPSSLVVIGARPSMGKTSFAMQAAYHMSGVKQLPTLVFSLEQPEEQLMDRMVANVARVDLHHINTGLVKDSEIQRCTDAMAKIAECKLTIDDEGGVSAAEIKAKTRRAMREMGELSCIIIDYLGEMAPPERGMSRYDAISENVRQLKAMAKELKVPVIVLAQLSRAVEQRQDKRPVMSDLRESGEIEQAADVILFLYRDKYYNSETEMGDLAEVIIAKNRNGPKGTTKFYFHESYTRFDPIQKGAVNQ